MPLRRSESQGGGDVSRHYRDEDGQQPWIREWMIAIRQLISELDKALPNTTVWGLTSHYSLGLMSVPRYDEGESHVWVKNFSEGSFTIAYTPPVGTLPIAASIVEFRAKGVDLAVEQIKIAMAHSRGWPDSPDLPDLSVAP